MIREILVDVAKYQPNSLRTYKNAGAKSAIVQVSVAKLIVAPKAKAQVKSAKANGLVPMGYFYACFGNSVSEAEAEVEACFAVTQAKSAGIPTGSFLAVDWESQDNNTSGGPRSNTSAILAAMDVIKKAGYKPLLYSSASLMRTKIDTARVIAKYGTCLWVASYPYSGATYSPDFRYFPSMKGVAIWQFTDNWKGLSVDGDIGFISFEPARVNVLKVKHAHWQAQKGVFILGQALKLHKSPHVSSPAIAKLEKGDSIVYDAILQGPLRLWIRQPREDGYGYMVARDRYRNFLGKMLTK